MKNKSTISYLLLSLFVFSITYIYSGNAFAATYNVPGDYATIQEAIDDPVVVNGDVINVLAGTHVEAYIHITKTLTITGQGMASTIIDTSSIGGFRIVFYPEADGIVISSMTIRNADQAIRFYSPGGTIDNTLLQSVAMINHSSRGIEIHNDTTVSNLVIDGCRFENTNHGLRVASSAHLNNVSFVNTAFTLNDIGIYVANGGGVSTLDGVDVTNCSFSEHLTAAMYFEEVQNALIDGNVFVNNYRDIQILKWYQPAVPVSNIMVTGNIMDGTTNSVFALFNAHNISGQTAFSNITIARNRADTSDASAVYAGAHSTYQNADPSLGGIGWNTVNITRNCFTGITTAGNGVRYFIPAGITPDQALGGASLNIRRNYWGTTDIPTITALMQVPAITIFTPIAQNANNCPPPIDTSPTDLVKPDNGNGKRPTKFK